MCIYSANPATSSSAIASVVLPLEAFRGISWQEIVHSKREGLVQRFVKLLREVVLLLRCFSDPLPIPPQAERV